MLSQPTSVGGTSRTHDGNGNLSDDGTYLFAYDFQNRLVRVTNKATAMVVADYRYDALGRRVEKAVNGGATTRYILHGVQVVEEFDGSNVWQARYVYEDGIDQPRCMDRADQADVNGNQNTTEVLRFHYHQQALGCVTEMTQPTGAVVEWVTYDVYGLPAIRDQGGNVITQSAVGNPYLYTGREYDPESGLYFYRARHYDPVAGRFLQRDPLGYVDSLSLHEYALSRPVSLADPAGTDADEDDHANAVHIYNNAQMGLFEAQQRAEDAAGVLEAAAQAVEDSQNALDDLQAQLDDANATLREMRARHSKVLERSCRRLRSRIQALWDEILQTLDALFEAEAREDAAAAAYLAAVADVTQWSSIVEGACSNIYATQPGAHRPHDLESQQWQWWAYLWRDPRAYLQGAINAATYGSASGFFGRAGRVAPGGLTTPARFFRGITPTRLMRALRRRLGPPRSSRPGANTFYNPRTRRSINVHTDPAHGPPHVDIRTRGPIPDRRLPLRSGGN